MEELYIKYHRELFLYAFSLCKDHYLAQDLTSDTFLKAYLSLDDVKYFKYWLFRVCKNLFYDHLKLQKEHYIGESLERSLSNNETPLDKIIESEKRQDIYNLILNLNESYREILILYYYADFSIREISSLIKTSEAAAKTKLYRARKKLKKVMEVENEL